MEERVVNVEFSYDGFVELGFFWVEEVFFRFFVLGCVILTVFSKVFVVGFFR